MSIKNLFVQPTEVEDLVECVVGWILEEAELGNKRQSMLDPQAPMEQGDDTITRLKAATSYDFVFTIVNSDPSRTNISFDIKHLIKRTVFLHIYLIYIYIVYACASVFFNHFSLGPFCC